MKYKTLTEAEERLRFNIHVEEGAIADYRSQHGNEPTYLPNLLARDKARLAHIERYNSMWKPQTTYKPPSRFDQFAYVIQHPKIGSTGKISLALTLTGNGEKLEDPDFKVAVPSVQSYEQLKRAGFCGAALDGFAGWYINPAKFDSARSQMLNDISFLWAADERHKRLLVMVQPGEGEILGKRHVKIVSYPKDWMNAHSYGVEFHHPTASRRIVEEWQPHVEYEESKPNPEPAVVKSRGPEYISVDQFLSAIAKPGREDELRGELERLFSR